MSMSQIHKLKMWLCIHFIENFIHIRNHAMINIAYEVGVIDNNKLIV